LKVGIIGAGAAGLAAAYDLALAGIEVVVYEKASFVGGQASTFDVESTPLERGYHHLFTSDTDILSLMTEIGLADRMEWHESKVGIFYGGKIFNLVTPMDLLKFSPLSIIDRIRMGLVTMILKTKTDWKTLENVTTDEWIKTWAGKKVYEVVWGPLLRGKFGDRHYKEIGMPWFWGKIHTRFASRGKSMAKELLGYPKGSFGEIFDTLAKRIESMGGKVKLSTGVKKIIIKEGKAVGLLIESDSDPKREFTETFDAILSTTPSFVFPKLVPKMPKEYENRLTKVQYMSAVLIILILDRPLTNVYWLNVADRSIPFVGLIEHTNMIDSSLYGGKHIVYLSNYLNIDHPLYKMDHKQLLAEYLPHIKKINADFNESWIVKTYYHKVGAAQPIIGVNYSQRIPDHRTPFERLYLANTTQIYPEDRGTNYSVRMGREVSKLLLKDYSLAK
jgi:protoporphyrinogen oxidase